MVQALFSYIWLNDNASLADDVYIIKIAIVGEYDYPCHIVSSMGLYSIHIFTTDWITNKYSNLVETYV